MNLLFSGDGLPNPRVPSNCQFFHLFNQHRLQMDALVGKHSLLVFPRPLPFVDKAPVFSFRSWCLLAKTALTHRSAVPTKISILFPARHNSPTPSLIPLLDRRYDLDPMRRFLFSTVVLPDIPWDIRDASGAVDHCRDHRQMPLLLFCFCSAPTNGPFSTPRTHWHTIPEQDTELGCPPPETLATHVVLNCHVTLALPGDSRHALSAIRILMLLNQFDPAETTSNFRGSSLLRYPSEPLPLLQKSAPDGVVVAHYHVPPHLLQYLDEDRCLLKASGIEWESLVEPHSGLFIVNHMPRKRPDGKKAYKAQSLQVRDGILAAPSVNYWTRF